MGKILSAVFLILSILYLELAGQNPGPRLKYARVESILKEQGNWDHHIGARVRQQNKSFKNVYEQLIAESFQQVYYISADKLTGSDHEATIDGTHLTDLGQVRLAGQISREITGILELQPR